MVPVIDVSKWQGSIDFHRMRAMGVQGLILRATNGLTVDPRLAEYHAGALAAGFPAEAIGFYAFCNPKRSNGLQAGAAFLQAVEQVHGHLDAFLMLDVETYVNEGGSLPVLTGPAYVEWLTSMVDFLEDNAPEARILFYTNAAYWNPNVGSVAFAMFDIIVARYPFYSVQANANHPVPADANQWAEWIMAETPKRPQVPAGWGDWDGWQFSAGFNGMGSTYGASSGDLDLNIIKPEAWARWTASATLPSIEVGPTVPDTIIVTPAVAAATGGNAMLSFIGQSPEVVRGKRWVWTGVVKFDTTETQANALIRRGAMGTGEGSRLETPIWFSAEEIASMPTVLAAADAAG